MRGVIRNGSSEPARRRTCPAPPPTESRCQARLSQRNSFMEDPSAFLVAVLLIGVIILLLVVLSRLRSAGGSAIVHRLDAVDTQMQQFDRTARENAAEGRAELAHVARDLREELAGALRNSSESLLARLAEANDLQRKQLETFNASLVALTRANDQRLEAVRTTLE